MNQFQPLIDNINYISTWIWLVDACLVFYAFFIIKALLKDKKLEIIIRKLE